ncbi:Myosin-IA [Operophtera brumata]|uniref:Myosin-IA n=2 Tax=Operophtera brumata TaxID=104452 RepID=A0A0L7L237_OPEBR|nr:Myosin-IA [Operophtera brumata]
MLLFQHNKIYTYIGEVLVSVNPYKTLDIYVPQHMSQYRGREMFEVPPHVYAVADACQRVLRQQVRPSPSTCPSTEGGRCSRSPLTCMLWLMRARGCLDNR